MVTFRIAGLYNWRYKKLGDLPHIGALPEYSTQNPGFAFNYQLIDVPDFNGVGETTPSPYFYQVRFYGLWEAKFAKCILINASSEPRRSGVRSGALRLHARTRLSS